MKKACSEPPPKFAFLSGIHPDLDAVLCECEADYAAFEYGHEHHSSKYIPQHHHSQMRSVRDENQTHGPARATVSLPSDEFMQCTKQQSSEFELAETSCDVSECVDSIPFSIDGMEKAKAKIKLQAAKIRDLEEKLRRMSVLENIESEVQNYSNRKILTPQERLDAHRERKNAENRYKDKCGRWESPPPIKKQSLISKVKPRDDFVDRLVSNPKERRRQEEVSRRISLSKANAERNIIRSGRDNSPLVRRQSIEEEVKASIKDIENDFGARDCLMKRLSMTVEERRDLEKKQVLAAVKRVKEKRQKGEAEAGESMQKIPCEQEMNNKIDTIDANQVTCHTCGSSIGCEEDTDDPGTFYCSRCWEEYERQGVSEDQEIMVSELDSYDNPTENAYAMSTSSIENTLWIVHDDPKLSSRLVCSGRNKMRCFIETKDPSTKQCLRILHGTIDYSGPVANSGGKAQVQVRETSRGTECICIGNIRGYIVHYDVEKLNLDMNQSLYEFRLDETTSSQLSGINAETSVKKFLEGCVGAVDVIFNPHHSPQGWYPLVEATSLRKIAPQFRSKGIGYIRLGDDMGKNGQAFMSSDGCNTFLFNEPVERENKNADLVRTASSFSSRHSKSSDLQSRRKSLQQSEGSRSRRSTIQILVDQDDGMSLSSRSSGCGNVNAGDILKELQSMDISKGMKWSDKADLLIKLGDAISRTEGRSWSESSLSYLQDIVSARNVNIHVLRSALVVIEKIGHVLKEELPNQIAWKTIMIETLNLLKNKQCGVAARDVLRNLHGKCYTIANSLTAISHVLGMGKQNATTQRKLQTKSDLNQQSKANNVEVIEWLAVTTESERLLTKINPTMDTSELELLATFFLRHESHRDARCRQNALDGLLHTMLYGIEVLGMRVDDVQLLCGDLKTLKPKSWNRLMRSLQLVLKVQHL